MPHSNEVTRHLLILLGAADPWALAQVSNEMILDRAHEVFSYTPNAWIVCTSRPTSFYSAIFSAPRKDGYGRWVPPANFVILDISTATVAAGVLPEDAWRWLQRHHMPKPAV